MKLGKKRYLLVRPKLKEFVKNYYKVDTYSRVYRFWFNYGGGLTIETLLKINKSRSYKNYLTL